MEYQVTETGCWEMLTVAGDGYGRVYRDGRTQLAHRISYEQHRGPIPGNLHIDHLCRNKGCINPDHLEPVTLVENVMRGNGIGARNAAKTHCPQGHPYDEANTIRGYNGGRSCRTCREAYTASRKRSNA